MDSGGRQAPKRVVVPSSGRGDTPVAHRPARNRNAPSIQLPANPVSTKHSVRGPVSPDPSNEKPVGFCEVSAEKPLPFGRSQRAGIQIIHHLREASAENILHLLVPIREFAEHLAQQLAHLLIRQGHHTGDYSACDLVGGGTKRAHQTRERSGISAGPMRLAWRVVAFTMRRGYAARWLDGGTAFSSAAVSPARTGKRAGMPYPGFGRSLGGSLLPPDFPTT